MTRTTKNPDTRRTVKNVGVWLTEYTSQNGDLSSLKPDSKDSAFMQLISFGTLDMRSCGWTKVGTATVIVSLIDENELVSNRVESLNAQLQKERADSEVRQNAILLQISKLQALEFTA